MLWDLNTASQLWGQFRLHWPMDLNCNINWASTDNSPPRSERCLALIDRTRRKRPFPSDGFFPILAPQKQRTSPRRHSGVGYWSTTGIGDSISIWQKVRRSASPTQKRTVINIKVIVALHPDTLLFSQLILTSYFRTLRSYWLSDSASFQVKHSI